MKGGTNQLQDRVYMLFANKSNLQMKISPLHKKFNSNITELARSGVQQYNSNFWFSANRKALKLLALQIKQQWLNEQQDIIANAQATIANAQSTMIQIESIRI
jgi:hypothetical protein